MTSATLFKNTSDITANSYCVFGLATCFVKNEGEVNPIDILEPIPSAALEALLNGIPTSYQWVAAESVGTVYDGQTVFSFPNTPESAQVCENFEERLLAAARTYKSKPSAQSHIALGQRRNDLNYSLERKRILNAHSIVRSEDNVKQHPHTHQIL